MKLKRISGTIFVGLAVSSCAHVEVHRETDFASKAEGVRFYMSAPYLFVSGPVELTRREQLYSYIPDGQQYVLIKECTGPECLSGDGSLPARPGTNGPDTPPPRAPEIKGPQAGKDKGKDKAADQGGDKGGDKGGAGGSATASSSPGSSSSAPSGAVTIVWLPDYCERYRVTTSNVLGSTSAQVTLNDGWQLNSLQTTADSTALATKTLDAVSSLAGTFFGKSSSGGGGGGKNAEGSQAGATVLLKRTVVTILKPGAYPLFKRTDCNTAPQFDFVDIATNTIQTETWDQLPPVGGS